jgi:hypothetical protein
MRNSILATLLALLLPATTHLVCGSEAEEATVSIVGQAPGPRPFIAKVEASVTPVTNLKSVSFTIAPKSGSVTRSIEASFSTSYLEARGYFTGTDGKLTVPVFGLYAAHANTVTLTYAFSDGSKKNVPITITTAPFDDPCEFDTPTVRQARTSTAELSYDFILVASNCSASSPTVLDTDGEVRWVGTAGAANHTVTFQDNAFYLADGPRLLRTELDGTVSVVADYTNFGVVNLHHNIDRGRDGLILDVDTKDYVETENIEVDLTGKVIRRWNIGEIIRAEMLAGGDDPDLFIKRAKSDYDFGSPEDWWHNNSTAYRKSDNTLIISSRENFVIAIDYDTRKIRWILGDTSKKWYQFPSLRKFALKLLPRTTAPVGQHSVSITHDDNLLLMDNGRPSQHQFPAGPIRSTQARKYEIYPGSATVRQVWSYPQESNFITPFCSSIYADAPFNYLIDYAQVGGRTAELLGLTPSGEKVFHYSYPTRGCEDAYRALPLHWEDLKFPATLAPAQPVNISSRLHVGEGERVGISGFIIAGDTAKQVLVRTLGPSLAANGVSGALPDPVLTLHGAKGVELASNDNWKEAAQTEIAGTGLAPNADAESAILATLAPGAYTAVGSSKDGASGVALVEVYDFEATPASQLPNISTRALVETGDKVLIGGFLLGGGTSPASLIVRALGPSLAANGVAGALQDPTIELRDTNGALILANDNWFDGSGQSSLVASEGLAPTDLRESAVAVELPPGAYTAVVAGKNDASGIALVEVYNVR